MAMIKPGTLCVILGSMAGNDGKVVTALRPFNPPEELNLYEGRWWEVDQLLPFANFIGELTGEKYPYASENTLFPIDPDGLEENEKEEEEELVNIR